MGLLAGMKPHAGTSRMGLGRLWSGGCATSWQSSSRWIVVYDVDMDSRLRAYGPVQRPVMCYLPDATKYHRGTDNASMRSGAREILRRYRAPLPAPGSAPQACAGA